MECESFDKFDGPAEADTTYVGGKADNMHKRRREKVIQGRGAVGKVSRAWRFATHHRSRAKPSGHRGYRLRRIAGPSPADSQKVSVTAQRLHRLGAGLW